MTRASSRRAPIGALTATSLLACLACTDSPADGGRPAGPSPAAASAAKAPAPTPAPAADAPTPGAAKPATGATAPLPNITLGAGPLQAWSDEAELGRGLAATSERVAVHDDDLRTDVTCDDTADARGCELVFTLPAPAELRALRVVISTGASGAARRVPLRLQTDAGFVDGTLEGALEPQLLLLSAPVKTTTVRLQLHAKAKVAEVELLGEGTAREPLRMEGKLPIARAWQTFWREDRKEGGTARRSSPWVELAGADGAVQRLFRGNELQVLREPGGDAERWYVSHWRSNACEGSHWLMLHDVRIFDPQRRRLFRLPELGGPTTEIGLYRHPTKGYAVALEFDAHRIETGADGRPAVAAVPLGEARLPAAALRAAGYAELPSGGLAFGEGVTAKDLAPLGALELPEEAMTSPQGWRQLRFGKLRLLRYELPCELGPFLVVLDAGGAVLDAIGPDRPSRRILAQRLDAETLIIQRTPEDGDDSELLRLTPAGKLLPFLDGAALDMPNPATCDCSA